MHRADLARLLVDTVISSFLVREISTLPGAAPAGSAALLFCALSKGPMHAVISYNRPTLIIVDCSGGFRLGPGGTGPQILPRPPKFLIGSVVHCFY